MLTFDALINHSFAVPMLNDTAMNITILNDTDRLLDEYCELKPLLKRVVSNAVTANYTLSAVLGKWGYAWGYPYPFKGSMG